MKRGSWIRLCLTGLVYAALAAPASALTVVEGGEARFEWLPATGPVSGYLVYVSENEGPFELIAYRAAGETWTALYGNPGDVLQVQVRATSDEVPVGPPSVPSSPIRFVAVDPDGPAPIQRPAMPMDFDGNGYSDLLFMNDESGELEAWLLDDRGVEVKTDLGRVGLYQRIVGNADYDGDGYADLLLHDDRRGELEVRYLSRGSRVESVVVPLASGQDVAVSPTFATEVRADVVVRDRDTGAMERPYASGVIQQFRSLPLDADLLASLDLDDNGVPEVLYQSGGQLIAQTIGGRGSLPVDSGPAIPLGSVVAGACSLPGSERDTLVVTHPFTGLRLYTFENGSRAQVVRPITNLSSTLRVSPIVGAGDYDADGDCDAAFASGNEEIWLLMIDENGADYVRRIDKPDEEWVLVGFASEAPLPSP